MKKSTKITLIVVACFVVLITVFFIFFDFAIVYGKSMENTYKTGDVVIYRRTQVVCSGDVVVFKKDNSQLIKRVVGTAGAVVEIKNDVVYLNGQVFEVLTGKKGSEDMSAITITENSIFVLGDNLKDSRDSRSFGLVQTSWIKGKVI